jgi:hypothetical protein
MKDVKFLIFFAVTLAVTDGISMSASLAGEHWESLGIGSTQESLSTSSQKCPDGQPECIKKGGSAEAGKKIARASDNCNVTRNSVIVQGASSGTIVYLENRGDVEAMGCGAVAGSIIQDNRE